MMKVQQLRIDHDHQNQMIWFSGTLSDGHKFSVGFPIAHVQVSFDEKAASMGWCGAPICGSVTTINGYLGTVFAASSSASASRSIAQRAHSSTMNRLATHATHYAKSAVSRVKATALKGAPRASHVLPAISAHGLAAYHAANMLGAAARQGTLTPEMQQAVQNLSLDPTHPIAALTLSALHSVRL